MANTTHASTLIGSSDKKTHVTLVHEWRFPRKNTEKIGANNAARHHGTTTLAECSRILPERKFASFRSDEPALELCYRVRFEKIFTSVRFFGERPNQTNRVQLVCVLSYQRSQLVTKTGLSPRARSTTYMVKTSHQKNYKPPESPADS